MQLNEVFIKAKKFNEALRNSDTFPQIVYKIKHRNYSGYYVEPVPISNLYTMNSLKLTTDFVSGFNKSFVKKYTSYGYKQWAKI